MVAVNILMKKGAEGSNNPHDISGIGVSNGKTCNIYAVQDLYRYLKDNPDIRIYLQNSIYYLVPIMALNGDTYIRSSSSSDIIDLLMKLPRI